MRAGQTVVHVGRVAAEARVALVEAVVEVAPEFAGEGWGLAAGSVGLDVTAQCDAHGEAPCGGAAWGGTLRVNYLE